jgi:hypothetical protein
MYSSGSYFGIVLCLGSAVGIAAPAAAAETPGADAHGAAVSRCTAMRGVDLSDDPQTPARVTEAAVNKPAADVPEVCMLDGYISPTTGFRIELPLEGWNGKYLQGGCGGACGTTRLFWCDDPLRRGYSCASTDMGHKGSTADWNWAANNLQGKADFGYRSTHLTALVGKALTARYFGKKPTRSYFFGCSTGGRQALVEAQDFPWDFDGIAAGSPPLDEIGTAIQLAWTVKANLDDAGKPILNEALVRLLHDAVLKKCDLNDGVADGVIGDPRHCDFRIDTLRCTAQSRGACLTEPQLAAAKKIYSGPVDASGSPIGRTGGAMLGSELYWLGDYIQGNGREPQYAAFIQNFLQYAAFDPPAGPTWKLADLDPVQDSQRIGMNEVLFDATNPDLRRFKSAGGKLIGFQGWADTSVVPMQYVDYYETVTRTMGGPEKTLDFYRFFTVPGMRHCSSDGAGGDTIDYLTALEQWVEQGKAPTVLIGANFDWQGPVTRAPVFPLDPARVRFTRPAYLYPAVPIYKGKGDDKQAESYRPSVAQR